MDPERWRRVEELYHSALERDPEQRHSFLVAVCGADEDILHEVETLLQVDAHGDFVIDKPAWDDAAHTSARRREESLLVTAPPSLSPGTDVGPYVIESRIGTGGMGEVYRARDTRLRRKVALKFLREDVADDAGRRRRFESEARAVAALNHPNIVSIFDFGQLNGYPYAVSELIEGQSLRMLLRRGPVPVRKLIDIAVQVADGLAAAHAARIAHRDLKPENMMITNEGRVKILDFGLAQTAPHRMETSQDASGTGVNLTEPGTIVGTPSYMSPEQARGAVADYRSDQFSFGLVLYELATGKQAFAKATTVETLTSIVRDEPAPIERKLPGPLRWTMDRCLAKDPRERYESTRDLYEDLRALRDHLSDAYSASELPESGQARAGISHRTLKAIAVIGMAISTLLIGVIALVGRKNAGADLATYQYVPFAIDAREQGYPIWSPDGKAIAYQAFVQGQMHIFVRYLASPVATDLGIRRDVAWPRRWSADSRRVILFATTPDSTLQNWKLASYSISAIGGDPAFITEIPKDLEEGDFSPDLRTLAVQCRCDGGKIGVFFSSPVGSPWRRYQPDPFAATNTINDGDLRFAPDGKKALLLYTGEKREPEAWILPFPPGSGPPRRVLEGVPPQNSFEWCSWMPDSRHFVFTMGTAGQSHLWLADADSNEGHQVTMGTSSEYEPAVSPDGTVLAFAKHDLNLNVISLSLFDNTTQTLVGTERRERMAAWAAKTGQLAYVTNRNGPMEIWIRSGDGSNRPVVTKDNFPGSRTRHLMNPSLSPDGNRIVFVRDGPEGELRDWIMSLSEGVPHRLNDSATDQEYGGVWSPDGSRFAYIQVLDKSGVLLVVNVGSAEPPRVLRKDVSFALPDWSPTGEWISFQDEGGWKVISPDGKTVKALGKIQTRHLAFSKDGKQLYGVREEHGGALHGGATLFSFDLLTGKMKDLRDLGHELAPASDYGPGIRFSLAPDGKSIAYSVGDFRSTLWLLEGFQQPSLLQRVFASRGLDHSASQ
jgi:serine/threonine protein kinase/Tol biopolymer transport system component